MANSVRSPLRLALAVAACALGIAAHGATATPSAPKLVQKPQPALSAARLESTVHDLINRERRALRLKPLGSDARLAAVARGHSTDMAKRSYFSHASPEGDNFDGRYRKAGYKCFVPVGDVIHGGAENIAREDSFASITTLNGKQYYDWLPEAEIARRAVAGWMKSPGHRANILTPYWSREGIGIVVTRDHRVYLTQDFC